MAAGEGPAQPPERPDLTVTTLPTVNAMMPTRNVVDEPTTAAGSQSQVAPSRRPALAAPYTIYFPQVSRPLDLPDLVVSQITSSGGALRVMITNQGSTDVTDPFWVEGYIAPSSSPDAVNQLWQTLGGRGIAWAITGSDLPLAPGDSLTLTLGDRSYRANYSRIGGMITAGTSLYVQVDSWNDATTYGAVLETHEQNTATHSSIADAAPAASTYNNIVASTAESDIAEPAPTTPTAPPPGATPTPTTPTAPPPGATSTPSPTTTPPGETTYEGTATMKVWYKAAGSSPAEVKTYRHNVTIKEGPPLEGDDGSREQNPFYYFANTPQGAGRPGTFAIYSATRYFSEEYREYTVFQYWSYTRQGTSYQGSFDPHPGGDDNFNIITTEDRSSYIPFCTASIKPGATIEIEVSDQRIRTHVEGEVYDPFVQQLCTTYIDRFDLTIDASN
ncbi:MAG: hypothetical protein HGA45_36355 [Chloroflexales bacterium]|nr:hypothetical protein [Chloroflexales bacterium]